MVRNATTKAVALVVPILGASAAAQVRSIATQPEATLQFDNDLFSGAHRDQDYSWGIAYSRTGTPEMPGVRLLTRIQNRLDTIASVAKPPSGDSDTAWQVGVLAFTPGTLRSPEPIVGDRPYASLIHFTLHRAQRAHDGNGNIYSALRIGWLGGRVAPRLHEAVHQWIGDEAPQGWHSQISDGGELTWNYWRIDETPIASRNRGKSRVSGHVARVLSVGTQTYAGVAVRGSWTTGGAAGDCYLPLGPGDYMAAVTSCNRQAHSDGWILHLGGLWRYVAHNSLLQGQFRASDYVVRSRNLRRDVTSFWISLERQGEKLSWAYSLRYSTPELRSGVGAREMIWAGLQLSRRHSIAGNDLMASQMQGAES